jgi:hypothetical protein
MVPVWLQDTETVPYFDGFLTVYHSIGLNSRGLSGHRARQGVADSRGLSS